ncbi:MAG: hypothetical protein AAF961_10220, partial [Planctomycetota bacterium]
MLTELARFAPDLSRALQRLGRQSVSLVMGEVGNFTRGFCERLSRELSEGAGRTIDVQPFNWS